MKQTAVDKFHDAVNDMIARRRPMTSNEVAKIWLECKEMEKEQIKNAWNHGFDWGMMEQSLAEQGEPSTLIDANHYYNVSYGGYF